MCGVFGVSVWRQTGIDSGALRSIVEDLFRESSSRGKEAAGLAIHTDENIHVYKKAMNANKLLRYKEFREFFRSALEAKADRGGRISTPISLIGHARLVTNGLQGINKNNQPTYGPSAVVVHNGIIVNEQTLWERYPELDRPDNQLDSTLIPYLFDMHLKRTGDLFEAHKAVYADLRGQATVLMLRDDAQGLLVGTNFGSLYTYDGVDGAFICASEGRFLENLRERNAAVRELVGDAPVRRLAPWEACYVSPDQAPQYYALKAVQPGPTTQPPSGTLLAKPAISNSVLAERAKILDEHEAAADRRRKLKRCTRCILPETVPGLTFDADGVCSYCHAHVPFKIKGKDALLEHVEQYRRADGQPELLMGVSGGRDSCFGLHYAVRELGLKGVAYTYDWALVTDLARRNISRMCYDLGIEHILVSADIQQKRKHIRDNINAWLREPKLGIIPLFMAGDKMYFYHYNRLRKERGIELVITCGNRFEKTDFKSGFCGVYNEKYGEGKSWRPYDMSIVKKLRYALYFGWYMGKNPYYWNGAQFDAAQGFWSSYFQKHDFIWLYDYIEWDEGVINSTLRDEYDWEVATDTKSTWRIGDGTAAFYNYIYYTAAGFSEFDTFRANQVREGQLTREQALALVEVENQPRYESIRGYAHLIGFDFDRAMFAIDRIPKLY